MELLSGGDVFDRIVGLKFYTEKDARDLAKLLLQSIEFLHNNGIAHRDIKPQNILLASKDDHSTIKISDFGFAKRVHTPKSLTSRCGTVSRQSVETRTVLHTSSLNFHFFLNVAKFCCTRDFEGFTI